ncbi:MAG: hypothetical protein J3R72DRAFT_455980 [Linnemannia gamsii]|nr:MAG: hypothetical protein J3R72DRAFT_455980 [Linnemannia gamsii]
MVFKSSLTVLLVASLAVFSSYTPQAEAHSWIDCVDWRKTGKNQWTANKRDEIKYCQGYARRYPFNAKFASLDDADPNRHYQQNHNQIKKATALACSDGRAGEEPGADETRSKDVTKAYGGKWGKMTTTSPGKKLCIRWPAKNHAGDSDGGKVAINWMKDDKGAANYQQHVLDDNPLTELDYSNCDKTGNEDTRACGGCITVPAKSTPGVYLLQWRWRLNKNEWYTSCADVKVGK